MKRSLLLTKIKSMVDKMEVDKQFRVSDFKFLKNSKSFLSKHRKGNPGGNTEYFVRVSPGLYELY